MSYVAAKGGGEAIDRANALMDAWRALGGDAQPLDLTMVINQLPLLHGRVLSEGGLYDPTLAALALKQSLGDPLEAALFVRAHRSAVPRLTAPPVHSSRDMRVIRRISAAFKDIPGGQMLGPTPDYLQRFFRFDLLDEDPAAFRSTAQSWLGDPFDANTPETFPKVLDALRARGWLAPAVESTEPPFDPAVEDLRFPASRSAQLAVLARGETGGLLALAYSNMKGYGDIHPTVGELRVGYVPVRCPHPITGEIHEIGEVMITECEVVAMFDDAPGDTGHPYFTLGYGACFGHNEVKAISMAVLDRALENGARHGPTNPSEDAQFVLAHIDGVESMGFCTHYKLPHHVTFASDADRLDAAQAARRSKTTKDVR